MGAIIVTLTDSNFNITIKTTGKETYSINEPCNLVLEVLYIHSSWLTACSTVPLEKLTATHLLKNSLHPVELWSSIIMIYGNSSSFTMLTSIDHWSVPCVRPIQPTPSHPISLYFNIILPSMLSSCKSSPVYISLLSHPCHIPPRSHPPWSDHCNHIRWGLQITM